jgi:hypothetical protein
MVWGFINGKVMGECMKGRCTNIRCMGKGNWCGRMGRFMKVCLYKMKDMVMVSIGGMMVECIKGSGEKGCRMEKVGSLIKKDAKEKEFGRWDVELVGWIILD